MSALAAALLVAACAVAAADESPEAASLAFRRGVEALRARDFAAAATAFQESYAAQPKAAAMCNLALTYDRWGGHVGDAIESYRKCAEDDSSGRFRDHALERARELRALETAPPTATTPPATPAPATPEAPSEPPAATTPPAQPATPTPAPLPPPVIAAPPPVVATPTAPPPPATRPYYADRAAVTLGAIGTAGILAGIGLFAVGAVDDSRIDSTLDLGQKASLYHDAGNFYGAGGILVGAGAALIVVGVIEWAAHGRHAGARPRATRAEVRF